MVLLSLKDPWRDQKKKKKASRQIAVSVHLSLLKDQHFNEETIATKSAMYALLCCFSSLQL